MKKGLFAGIVIVVICACAISIMCVTGVFSKKENNKTTTEKTEEKEQLCSKTYNVGDDTYKVTIEKLNSSNQNKIILSLNNKIIDSYEDDISSNDDIEEPISTENKCKEVLNTKITTKGITQDNNYKYYLVTMPIKKLNQKKYVLSKNLKTNEYTKLINFVDYEFGVVAADKYQENGENKCQNRDTIDVVDNYVSEFEMNEKNYPKAHENKYTFADGTYAKTTTEDIYIIACNEPM